MARSDTYIDDSNCYFWDTTSFCIYSESKLQMKKAHMYAAETAHQGAIYFSAYGLMGGIRQVEGVNYKWTIERKIRLCVVRGSG